MSSHVLSARVSDELAGAIINIAKERHRKPAEVVREALELYLESWADHKIALDRMKNPADKIVDEKELLEGLGWSR